jgi:2-polyprenyl-3-methyl-5-hydroxy-6-metoxy-1,4-benzoquinol methylase
MPTPTPSALPATPAAVAALARALYTSGPAVARAMQHYRPYISPFERLLTLVPPGSSVLDIGCGGGLFLGLLARTGRLRSGLGIDTSGPAIAAAQAMQQGLDARGQELRFEARSAALALPAGPFDVVSLLDVMHHIPPAQQRPVLLQALGRVAPGGRFIYKDMCLQPAWRAAANRLHDLLIARQWIHYLPLAQAVDWAEAAGFRVLQRQRVDMLWYGHEIVVFEAPLTAR